VTKIKKMLKDLRAEIEHFLEEVFLDKQSIGVFADLCIELSGVMLVSIPGFFLAGAWLQLTNSITIFILATYSARTLRKRTYDTIE
jgi:hypothetical protein